MQNIAKDVAEEIQRRRAATFALLDNWAGTLEGQAKENKTWRDRTAHATQSLHSGVEQGGDTYTLYLAHGMAYGRHLEEGTGLYGPLKKTFEIRPKNKKALFWAGASHPVKKVTHPGMKPRPIVEPTMAANEHRIMNTVKELWGGK